MFRLLKNFKAKEWLSLAASVVFITVQVWLDLKIPDYMSKITTLINTPGTQVGELLGVGGFMLLCALGSLAAAFATGFLAARIAAGFSRRLREKVFFKVEGFSMEEINSFSTPSLITRTTNDITQVQIFIAMGLQVLIKAPIMAVWALTKISTKSWQWTAAAGVALGVMLAIICVIVFVAMPKFKRMQILTDNLNRVTRENLTGLRVVRAYNAEKYQGKKFEKANSDLTGTQLFTSRTMAILNPGMTLIMNGLMLAVYWIGATLINDAMGMDKLALFSDMIVFTSYAMQVIMAFMMLTMVFIMLPRASVSASRINEVLNTKPSILEGKKADGMNASKGLVEFRHVSFKYPDAAEYVLYDVSFTAHQGDTVAFIGSTGSGKSTLINLVPRFYDATEGEVLLDGVNVKDYTLEALNNKIGYVPQRAVLFSGTIKSNVTYGDNGSTGYTDEQVRRAIEIAQAADFVDSTHEGVNSPIAQGGTNVSGGQKQRLAIARAICRDPEVLIFDDSFSALDYKTDRVLRSALKRETADTTVLIVAQRIGTIKDADLILVLDEGKVVGSGTHSQLLDSCQVYQQIAYSQLSKEELGND